MSARALAEKISSALNGPLGSPEAASGYSSGTPAQANAIIAQAITEYLLANVKVVTSYTGTTPTGSPEAGVGEHPISGAVPPPSCEGAPPEKAYQVWVDSLGAGIAGGFVTLPSELTPPVTPVDPHVSLAVPVTQLSLLVSREKLQDAHSGSLEDPQVAVWEEITKGIFQMIGTQLSEPFTAGITGTGEAVVTKLMIS